MNPRGRSPHHGRRARNIVGAKCRATADQLPATLPPTASTARLLPFVDLAGCLGNRPARPDPGPDLPMPAQDRFPGRTGRLQPRRRHEVFPDGEAMPCATFEDTIAAVQSGAADSRRRAGRELALWPHRRHPPPAARKRPLHHRRALPARRDEPAGRTGRHAGRHQGGAVALGRPRPVPQVHPQHRLPHHQRRRYRRLRPRNRREGRQVGRRHRLPLRRRDLRPRRPRRATSRTPSHNTTRFLGRQPRAARNPHPAARSRPPSSSASATCRPRSTRRWAASPPTAST